MLPFGLAMAHRDFTKTMAVIAALRQQCILVFPNIDGWLLVAYSLNQLNHNLSLMPCLLSGLGLRMNLLKAHLEPTRVLHFIEDMIHFPDQKAYLPEYRAVSIQSLAHTVLMSPTQMAEQIQRLLGYMAVTTFVLPYARLHIQLLQLSFLCHFTPSVDP